MTLERGTKIAESLTGARYLAQSLHDYGVTDVFFMEVILRHTLLELEKLGVRRVLAHSEKGAAYMADGYARASGKVGICMAQSVGATNLAAGLQDAYLAHQQYQSLLGWIPRSLLRIKQTRCHADTP